MVELILPKKLQKDLDEKKRAQGEEFVKDRIYQIAQRYYEKFKEQKELWILIAAKKDLVSRRINVMIRAADRANKHRIDVPMQGCQLWYTNQVTGEIKPEWILPLSLPREKDSLERVSGGNILIKNYLKTASERVGYDLLTGHKVKTG